MAALLYSGPANSDLIAIGNYTLQTWGPSQAVLYLKKLRVSCRLIAQNPLMGRRCDDVSPGLRRIEIAKHVIFYRIRENGIRIIRILHKNALPRASVFEDL